jgi:hypothetical protein
MKSYTTRNSYHFSFQDLIHLRTARELAGARVPPRRIKGARPAGRKWR